MSWQRRKAVTATSQKRGLAADHAAGAELAMPRTEGARPVRRPRGVRAGNRRGGKAATEAVPCRCRRNSLFI
jgi:hypothetical protein